MISTKSIAVCRVICSCETLRQLTTAERYMIHAAKDFTHLIAAKRLQLLDAIAKRRKVNKQINDNFNQKVDGYGSDSKV
tara:strand:- start:202 stop:438 length:237 start_codon:yes stop_codon:yes gene_type:complete